MIEAGKKYKHVSWDFTSHGYILIISVNRSWVEAVYRDNYMSGSIEKYELQMFASGWIPVIDFQDELEWL